jgi:WD40 repeat protein
LCTAPLAVDGTRSALLGFDASVTIWDVFRHRPLAVLPAHESPPKGLAFSGDGAKLASADGSGIRVWDAGTGALRASSPRKPRRRQGLAFTPDGRTLAAATEDGTIVLWDVEAGTERVLSRTSPEAGWGLAFAEEGHVLASIGLSHLSVDLRETADGRRRAVLACGSRVQSMAVAPGGRVLATACFNGDVPLWDVSTGLRLQVLRVSEDPVIAVAFSPDGTSLACGGFGAIRLFPVGEEARPGAAR